MSGIRYEISGDASNAMTALDRISDKLRKTAAVGQTFGTSLQESASKAGAGLSKVTPVSDRATNSLMNLSRVAQDAPYGFIGIANNLNPLIESFQRLKVSTGTTSGALKAMGSALVGPAGLGLAVGVISSLLVTFGDRLFGASATMSKVSKLLSETKDTFISLTQSVEQVKSSIDLAKKGYISKDAALKLYNDTLGKSLGITNDLNIAESIVVTRGGAFIQMMLQKAVAAMAYKEAADKLFQIQLNNVRMITEGKTQFGLLGDAQDIAGKKLGKTNASLQKQADTFLNIGRNINLIAAAFARMHGINESVDIRAEVADPVGTVKDLQDKIRKLPPLKVRAAYSFDQGEIDEILDRPDPVKFQFRGLEDFQLKVAGIRREMEKLAEVGQYVGSAVANSFGNVFDSLVEGENAVRALGNAVKALVVDLIKAAIQSLILKFITSAITGSVGTQLNLGSLAGVFGGGFAGGGEVSGRRMYLVGERGPELFVPSSGGSIIPNHRLDGLVGSAERSVNINISGRISGRDIVYLYSQENEYQRRNG